MNHRIGILISGRGSNMLALADAVDDGRVPNAEVAVVISDHADAVGLRCANERGLHTLAIERKGRSREEHDRLLITALQEKRIDLVCLAGYMRLLSPCFIAAFPRRILNIHPSLLPSFPGLDVHRQVLEHGVKWTGCTVHFVDETLDGGPIVAQRVVPVLDDDSEETLAARVLVEEHKLYAEAIALVIGRNYDVVGRKVTARPIKELAGEVR